MPEIVLCGQPIKVSCPNHFAKDDAPHNTDQPLIAKHWHIEPGMVVIDAGTGPGSWTLYAAAKGARVIAFEPDCWSYNMLRTQLELNGFQDRVAIVEAALRDEDGPVPWGPQFVDPNSKQYVTGLTLDTFFEHNPVDRLDAINMDVEGCELRVIKGAKKTLAKFHPKLIIEVHLEVNFGERVGVDYEELQSEIRDLGYDRIIKDRGPLHPNGHSDTFLIASKI